MNAGLYSRYILKRMDESLQDTPAILLSGPRQSGKTTLVRSLARSHGFTYLTLDDEATLLSAKHDPVGLVQSCEKIIFDEVQREPRLFLAIKKSIDEDRRPGRFVLTGSANLLFVPSASDSLAGRMENLTLLPLAQAEMAGHEYNWIDAAFAGEILTPPRQEGEGLQGKVLAGGYPECLKRTSARRRNVWLQQYLNAILQRDIHEIAETFKLRALSEFMRALALTAGHPCNVSKLGAQMKLDGKTCARYIHLLQQVFLVTTVPMWSKNSCKRLTKTPRIHFLDSGLLANLAGVTGESLTRNHQAFGGLFETFVHGELAKFQTWSETDCQILSYRDQDKVEVDFVLERANADIVAIEVKAGVSIGDNDLRGLRKLASLAGENFVMGVILFNGDRILPLGERLWGVPVSSLWGTA